MSGVTTVCPLDICMEIPHLTTATNHLAHAGVASTRILNGVIHFQPVKSSKLRAFQDGYTA
jgi:hypothetical protein